MVVWTDTAPSDIVPSPRLASTLSTTSSRAQGAKRRFLCTSTLMSLDAAFRRSSSANQPKSTIRPSTKSRRLAARSGCLAGEYRLGADMMPAKVAAWPKLKREADVPK